LKRYTDELDSAESIVLSLALTIESRDPYTRGHCDRLAEYASALGKHLGLDRDRCRVLYRGGFLHDVGKIGIPDVVLQKPAPLTASEYALMQQHTTIGDTLCSKLRSLDDVRPIVRHHHERTDGSGYPDGLRGDDIPLLAQIVAVVDAYDAITTDRPHKAARTQQEAFAELREDARKGWKRETLVESFVAMMAQHECRADDDEEIYDASTTEGPYKPALTPAQAIRELREEAATGMTGVSRGGDRKETSPR
jgi:putative two-component system response regulator